MSRHPRCPRVFALALLFVALSFSQAFAHCFVGARFFPATLAIDDPCVADELSLPTVSCSKTGDVPLGHRMGYFGGTFETHHRGFRHLDRRHLVANPPARRSDAGRFRRSRNHAAVPVAQGQYARTGDAARTDRRLGRHRRQQFRNRNAVQPVHPDLLFRQGLRRPARQRRMAARLRGDRTGRLSDSDQVLRSRGRTPSFRRCWSMAARCNTACRTSNRRSKISSCPISSII